MTESINRQRKMTRREKEEELARVRRFLALSPELQEGALQYAEKIKKAYLEKNSSKTY